MDFSDIINDLIKLEGIRLNSIRPGAEITIKQVDLDQKKVIVESSSGKLQSRPFSEFQRIWEALLAAPAIRVEEVLHGSGSSRNQPETIFANLPYIQWLRINNKKHISYVKTATHPYGTICEMDSMQAAQLGGIDQVNLQKSTVLIVTDNIGDTVSSIKRLIGVPGKADQDGNYIYNLSNQTIVLTDARKCQLPCGTYSEVWGTALTNAQYTASFLGQTWKVFSESNLKIIIRS